MAFPTGIDLTGTSLYDDGIPHELFRKLRAETPVGGTPRPPEVGGFADEGFWVVSTHELVREGQSEQRQTSSPARYPNGPGDFVTQVATELPLQAIADIIGLPLTTSSCGCCGHATTRARSPIQNSACSLCCSWSRAVRPHATRSATGLSHSKNIPVSGSSTAASARPPPPTRSFATPAPSCRSKAPPPSTPSSAVSGSARATGGAAVRFGELRRVRLHRSGHVRHHAFAQPAPGVRRHRLTLLPGQQPREYGGGADLRGARGANFRHHRGRDTSPLTLQLAEQQQIGPGAIFNTMPFPGPRS